ncbi:MAG: hypothetical protein E7354_04660 [Clostridiales bacterium]|nr:hypothetical protein [Clostridiales bacterium]
MINLAHNAKQELNKLLSQKEMKAAFLSACDSYKKKYTTRFSNDMQTLITKVGLLVSKLSTKDKITSQTFLGSIDFLCKKVIEDPARIKFLRATSINENGNKNKHTLDKNEEMNLDECIHQYNTLLDKIAQKYKQLDQITDIKIYKTNQNKNIFAEKKSVKYGDFSGNKLQFRLSPFFTFDKYAKQAVVSLAVDWESKSDDDLKLTICSKKSKKELLNKRFSLKNSKYENFDITFTSNDMYENNQLALLINVEVYRDKEVTKTKEAYYTTGILFWKKYHSYDREYKTIEKCRFSSTQVEISQRLREEKSIKNK